MPALPGALERRRAALLHKGSKMIKGRARGCCEARPHFNFRSTGFSKALKGALQKSCHRCPRARRRRRPTPVHWAPRLFRPKTSPSTRPVLERQRRCTLNCQCSTHGLPSGVAPARDHDLQSRAVEPILLHRPSRPTTRHRGSSRSRNHTENSRRSRSIAGRTGSRKARNRGLHPE